LVTFDVSAAGGGGGANRTFRVDWQDADPKQLTEGTDDTLTVEVTDRDTSEPINDASIDYSFSAIGNPMRSIDISLATGNHDGTATIDLSSNDAQAGDEFDVYAAAGDDVDVIRVEIVEPGAPEFTSIDVTSSGNGQQNNQLTFTYGTTDDATGVTLFAQSTDGTELVNDATAPTDGSTGESYTFGDVQMNQQDIDIEMTVQNANGDSRTCTGTITTLGGSLSLSGMQCSVN
jgi:hypothetical protein